MPESGKNKQTKESMMRSKLTNDVPTLVGRLGRLGRRVRKLFGRLGRHRNHLNFVAFVIPLIPTTVRGHLVVSHVGGLAFVR